MFLNVLFLKMDSYVATILSLLAVTEGAKTLTIVLTKQKKLNKGAVAPSLYLLTLT